MLVGSFNFQCNFIFSVSCFKILLNNWIKVLQITFFLSNYSWLSFLSEIYLDILYNSNNLQLMKVYSALPKCLNCFFFTWTFLKHKYVDRMFLCPKRVFLFWKIITFAWSCETLTDRFFEIRNRKISMGFYLWRDHIPFCLIKQANNTSTYESLSFFFSHKC